MRDSIETIGRIREGDLNGERYFQSLLEQAHAKGILCDDDIERLQHECLALLADTAERYNAGASSSIRVEKAQDLLASNFFTIGLGLKAYPSPDAAAEALRSVSARELYSKGRRRINTMRAYARTLHAKLLEELIDTQNVFYRATIKEGIDGFFKLYDADFSAHKIHITADYPAFCPPPALAGIEFIRAYLHALYCENLFCRYFFAEDIHHLLCGYAVDYQGQPMNIFEPVLLAALGCAMAGRDARRLDISQSGAAYLFRLLDETPQGERPARMRGALHALHALFRFPPGLWRYLQSSLPLAAQRVAVAVRIGTLGGVFALPAYPEREPRVEVSFGVKMGDEHYREVVEELRQCRFSGDKLSIIKAQARSLADLEDMLLDAELTEAETHAVLRELSLLEMAALARRHALASEADAFALREQERLLQKRLHGFIAGLPRERREMIERAGAAIKEAQS